MKLTLICFLTERLRNKFANAKNTHCAPMVPLLVPKLANSLITNASYLSLGSANKIKVFLNHDFRCETFVKNRSARFLDFTRRDRFRVWRETSRRAQRSSA